MNASNPKFRLIVGLGNPDSKYANTYHNVGHLFIDYLMTDPKLQTENSNLQIYKSTVFMNLSGMFVKKMLKKSGAKPEQILIVHDDSDIEIGKYKLSFGRGAAGHHGVENIQATIKTKKFWRLRIGIRPQPPYSLKLRRIKAEKFVLKKITGADKKLLEKVFEKSTTEII